MGKHSERMIDQAVDRLQEERKELIAENARLLRERDANKKSAEEWSEKWRCVHGNLLAVQAELSTQRNANAALKATIARLTKAGKVES